MVGSSLAFYVILCGIGVLRLVGQKMKLNLNLSIKRKTLLKVNHKHFENVEPIVN